MINPWLSDFSADYMDQPTELSFILYKFGTISGHLKLAYNSSGSKFETDLGIYDPNLG